MKIDEPSELTLNSSSLLSSIKKRLSSRAAGHMAAIGVLGGLFLASFLLNLTPDGTHISDNILTEYAASCTFLELTGRPCPTCGMTRAFVALSHGEFITALRHHLIAPALYYFFLFLLIAEVLALLTNNRFKLKISGRLAVVIVALFVLSFMAAWVIKLFGIGGFSYPV